MQCFVQMLRRMATVRWDVHELLSQHNHYVDELLVVSCPECIICCVLYCHYILYHFPSIGIGHFYASPNTPTAGTLLLCSTSKHGTIWKWCHFKILSFEYWLAFGDHSTRLCNVIFMSMFSTGHFMITTLGQ